MVVVHKSRIGVATVLAAACIPGARAWISTSQSRYGATIEGIQNETLGLEMTTPIPSQMERQMALGYLWSLPVDSASDRGLGGSITWAIDDKVCNDLLPLFNEKFWFFSFINCLTLHSTLHRAFNTWAMNSKHIKFTEVTKACRDTKQMHENCTFAEIWVTTMKSSVSNSTNYREAANAKQTAPSNFPTDFRSTNGLGRFRVFHTHQTPRPVTEIQRGTMSFQTEDICWYVDSKFCANWHAFKQLTPDNPQIMFTVRLPAMRRCA